ncbi:MAG: choice-of-anchor D domain-containing protein, partial [Acidobacteria bacterium]|nr:choice-of-anchor D domain-containing protein [Acidobacteriota bacterium]
TISSNDATNASLKVPLNGVGIAAAPKIVVEPASLDFGTVATGQTTARTIRISNTGDALLTVSGVSAGGMFVVLPPGFPLPVAMGADAVITVLFNPGAEGAQNGMLTITSNDPANSTLRVPLTGVGS